MKNIFFAMLVCMISLLIACGKDTVTVPEYEGETLRLDCFDRIGIKTSIKGTTDSVIFLIPDELLPKEFEKEGVKLLFDAKMRPNTLTPLFPDPSFSPSSLFQAKITNVQENKN
ncbi:MAG: hypothetical protein RIR11_4048 [Bacteroidota bacterium]|jgi:hypothetical protein